jgi:hypothetical protein
MKRVQGFSHDQPQNFNHRTDNMEETNESKIKTIPLDLLPVFFIDVVA